MANKIIRVPTCGNVKPVQEGRGLKAKFRYYVKYLKWWYYGGWMY